jgi:hypothetical protein
MNSSDNTIVLLQVSMNKEEKRTPSFVVRGCLRDLFWLPIRIWQEVVFDGFAYAIGPMSLLLFSLLLILDRSTPDEIVGFFYLFSS